jgi:cation-dependent mannose-6-phosphate receptor
MPWLHYLLTRMRRKDYQIKTANGYDLILNVCKSVAHETWNIDIPDPGDVAGFIRRPRGDFSIG